MKPQVQYIPATDLYKIAIGADVFLLTVEEIADLFEQIAEEVVKQVRNKAKE